MSYLACIVDYFKITINYGWIIMKAGFIFGLLFAICSGTVQAQAFFSQVYEVPLTGNDSQTVKNWVGGLNSGQYGKVDLNGDGKKEWVIYDRSSDFYLVYEVKNDELIYTPHLAFFLPEIKAGWVVFADFDRNGKKDIFTNGDRGIIVYKNITIAGEYATWREVANPLLTTGFSGKINLIANAADIPGISDIDGDGDLDIIVYNFAIGGYIRYNKNLSMDLYGHTDSLDFEISTRRWGNFEECDCNMFAFSPETCGDLNNGRVMHPGGKALLAIDLDGDMDKDLLAGHEQCEELYLFENYGTPDSAFMMDYSGYFPDSINPANFHIFPAGYYEDLNFDGIKDLIVAPNVDFNIDYKVDFKNSSLLYLNRGENDLPKFEYSSADFIQGDMLDLGENTMPTLIDHDGDGDLDLFVAANGFATGSDFTGYISYIENTGNTGEPGFQLRDDDFLNLSNLDLKDPKLSFADMNDDEAIDLIYTGTDAEFLKVKSYLFYNRANGNELPIYSYEDKRPIELPDFFGLNDSPEFFDVNEDDLTDLLIGKQDGALEYYVNQGSADNEDFVLENGTFLGIGRDFTLERIFLVASVGDVDNNSKMDLVTTDYRGIAQIYFDFQSNQDNAVPVEVVYLNEQSQTAGTIDFDTRTWMAIGDIFSDGASSMIAGGVRGGLQIFRNDDAGNPPGGGEKEITLDLYPNPLFGGEDLIIHSNQNIQVEIFNTLGQSILQPFEVKKYLNHEINLQIHAPGVYIFKAIGENGAVTSQRIVISR